MSYFYSFFPVLQVKKAGKNEKEASKKSQVKSDSAGD
jgi:hypothetical protein